MESRRPRDKEPPTLALRLKPYKAAIQQLRSIVRVLKDNATVSFLPAPAMVLQTVRPHCVSKITFNSTCLYITDRSFQPKTINNAVPLLGNFLYLTSNRDLTKFYVQDTCDLSATICMAAADFTMEFSSACVHGQELVRETGESSVRVDLDFSVVLELLKWIAPHVRAKRHPKRSAAAVTTAQILVHANPPTIKFVLLGSSELEFTATSRVSFHEVKNVRMTVQLKNFHLALTNCAVTKLACVVRVISDHEALLCVSSKNSMFSVENFLTEEPFARAEPERATAHRQPLAVSNSVESNNDAEPVEAPPKKAHVANRNKGDGGEHGRENKYEQHKITNYLVAKTAVAANERGGSGFFGDAKEESDSEESVTFEFVSNPKKQKCA
ncbi:T44 [Tupaiid betaherpesvirus 1]|uniref:DNA polymerase processivity factor n=1 Tax=Tupaiid herpesvirus 1 (strain 1) TaxID=10397 RepID=Q91TP5_TUHV1|nr:T44 [Tupaiid betaherpesvirus 1]AAK57092.1 T44 [Tupaiid betaherpesvirus 1]